MRKKGNLEFRYYEVPADEPLLALLGDAWIRPYGYDGFGALLTNLHFHNLLEIGYCYDGSGVLTLENEQHRYGSGTTTIIPKNYPHTTTCPRCTCNRWEYLFINAEKTLSSFYPDNPYQSDYLLSCIESGAFCTNAEESPELCALVLDILREMTARRDLYVDAVNGLLRALFVEISRQHPLPEGRALFTSAGHNAFQVSRAIEYVGNHFSTPIRIKDLADVCNMSETHFRRLFVESMGVSPGSYINQVRIRAACEKLRKTKESVADIAESCGFSCLSTFNRNFQKYSGMTPNELRKSPEAYEHRLSGKRFTVLDGWS